MSFGQTTDRATGKAMITRMNKVHAAFDHAIVLLNAARRFAHARPALVVALLLALFAANAIASSAQHSGTFDETIHLPAGYTYLRTNDYRLSPSHPPLAKMLAALPLLCMGDLSFSSDWPEWRDGNEWTFGQRFLYRDNNPDAILLLGRSAITCIGCLLGLLIYAWTRELYGQGAALCSLFVFTFTPEFLAHSAVVTTDVAVTTFLFSAHYFLWRCLKRLTILDLTLCALSLGAAASTKFSGILFLPIFIVAPLVRALYPKPLPVQALPDGYSKSQRGDLVLRTPITRLTCLAAVSLYIVATMVNAIWFAYGLHDSLPKSPWYAGMDWNAVVTPTLTSTLALKARDLHLLPDIWIYGFLDTAKNTQNRVSFLLGEYSWTGFHSYFPLVALAKTPIPESVILLGGIAVTLKNGMRRAWRRATVIVPAVYYFALAVSNGFNIGHRHILPIYPFLMVCAGGVFVLLTRRAWSTAFAALGLGWLCVGTLAATPNYLSYFNEAVGGSRGGLNIVVDSNLDWGQDLPALKRWMTREKVNMVYLSYFGTARPEAYGIEYMALPSVFGLTRPVADMDPGRARYVAISATNLRGLYMQFPHYEPFRERLARLRTKSVPKAVLGGSIYIYDISEPESSAISYVK
jgi:hypothetical protein